MYYFQYPTTGVGAHTFPITVNGDATTGTLRGGDGSGGPYQWSNMPLIPNAPALAQAEAVGALVYDAGVAVSMDYESGGSSAAFYLAQQALTNVFQFASASYNEDDNNGLSGTNLLSMINPSLDARLPVLLGIEPDSGHCLLADGYGYSASTLFHHLNTGWGGDDDIWYSLPAIDTSDSGDFTMVIGCIYNVYASGAGEIISGRVTDPTGAPISGASITALQMGGGTYTATTDSNGIYALARLPSASDYTLTVTNAGDAPASDAYSTGTSTYNGSSGNVWGANFVLSPPLLAIPETGFSAIGPVGGPFSAYSQAFVLTNTSAAAVNWTLANSNSWLSATSTSGTVAPGGASILTISLNAAANSLAAGTNNATLWMTNLGSNLAQPVPFTLTVENADYPISVSGYNQDVVVESAAIGGNSTLYATAFDPKNAIVFGESFCFYENGLVATNLQGGMAAEGLPQGGLFTSAVDHATTFQLGPYTSGNVLYLTPSASSAALTLNAPSAYKSLSVLAASADGGGNGSLVIHFADGSSSSPISFNAGNYFVISGAPAGTAISRFGVEVTGDGSEFLVAESSSYYPALYQTSIDLQSLGLHTRAITSVSFTMPAGPAATGIFALSGTESPFPVITAQPQSMSVAAGADVSLSVGAVGAGTLSYRWLFDGSALAGGQGNPLNVTNAGAANAGSYQVIVTNTSGSVTSLVAVLSIATLPLSFVTGPNALQYSGGKMILQLTNLPGQGPVVLAASTNLLQWVPVFTNPPGLGTFTFTYTDSAAGTFPLRFYRAVTP
jgi:hypothetical protein